MPNGCSDDLLPWRRTAENKLDTKYPYVCHAELNAIMNKNSADVKGCSMYVALFPCNECAKLIIQAGIKEVIFMSDKYHDSEETTAARLLFKLAGVTFRVKNMFDLFIFLPPFMSSRKLFSDRGALQSVNLCFRPAVRRLVGRAACPVGCRLS
ncbi:deoxycytidylate deaminase isoform X4 [Peromyscus californicus insignis]|nr:deoxycytidylate deaminase isoform X4 [Peromyscus californicus insignis]XP_052608244.1 deoxycytidylate deaminase isoform X4 [Peromyscus californicus insignis]